jgi:hypothetical protein
LRPVGALRSTPPGFGPRNLAAVFATREEAQQEIDAIRKQDSGLFKFEIQPE